MRIATEIQGSGESMRRIRGETPTAKQTGQLQHETDQQKSQNGAAAGEEYFALVARATNDAIRDWNVKTGELSWPEGLESLLGYQASDTTGTIAFWQKQLHPEDRTRAVASIEEALASKAVTWSGEYRFRCPDDSYLHLMERACIVRNPAGGAVRFVGSLMDISARKHLHDQLCRSQKMEAFGQLAGGVAHDFNNFLTTILGYSDLLLDELGVKNGIAKHIAEIRAAAGRASALTGQLLAFSRKHPLAPRLVEVNALISNLERTLLRLLGENIAVECHLLRAKEGAHIQVDPGQLTQIILNLVVNARDAMPNGGRLLLEIRSITITDEEAADIAFEELTPGEFVTISVCDTGAGMTAEVQAHLFEPFFTTKAEESRSSGLGLATSYGIVRQSGGGMGVRSKEGNGTTVTIYLPRIPAPPARSVRKPTSKKMLVGTETILLLEDDVSVRHISVRVLRSLGYDVLEAANSDDAQRLIAQGGDRKIHLLLTDMVMPQMSGRRFADWLRQTSPHTKVIFVSGYLEESLLPGDRCGGEMFFLPKPFDSEQLASKVREALDS